MRRYFYFKDSTCIFPLSRTANMRLKYTSVWSSRLLWEKKEFCLLLGMTLRVNTASIYQLLLAVILQFN